MKYIPVIIVWALCAWLAFALLDTKKQPDSPMVGRMLPVIALPSLEDSSLMSLAELRQQQISIVHFFASWCLPCQKEHETLLKLHKQNSIRMLGIAWKNKQADANAWLAKLGMPYDTALYDLEGKTTVPFGLTGVPETFVVDANGKILFHSKSILTDAVIQQEILPFIKEAK